MQSTNRVLQESSFNESQTIANDESSCFDEVLPRSPCNVFRFKTKMLAITIIARKEEGVAPLVTVNLPAV